MKVEAAVIRDLNEPWSVEEVDLDGPSEGEVLVHVRSTGLCRTSDHLTTGVVPFPYPAVGGHEAEITSSVYSPGLGKVIALGYVRG